MTRAVFVGAQCNKADLRGCNFEGTIWREVASPRHPAVVQFSFSFSRFLSRAPCIPCLRPSVWAAWAVVLPSAVLSLGARCSDTRLLSHAFERGAVGMQGGFKTILDECDLRGVELGKAKLNGVSLIAADLSAANLVCADLENALLSSAILRYMSRFHHLFCPCRGAD